MLKKKTYVVRIVNVDVFLGQRHCPGDAFAKRNPELFLWRM